MAQKITRQQLARICSNDEQAIRFFEDLIRSVNDTTPQDLTEIRDEAESASNTADSAITIAQSLSAMLARVADDLIEKDSLPPFPIQPQRPKYYGSFSDTTTQTAAAINTAYAMTFNTTDLSYGVSVGSPTSRVYVDSEGTYNFQFSAQLDKTAGGVGSVYIWCRVNGVNVPNSTGHLRLKDNSSEMLAAWNYVLELNAGDYFELMWEVDDTTLQIHSAAASAVHPAIPSVILTVTDNIS